MNRPKRSPSRLQMGIAAATISLGAGAGIIGLSRHNTAINIDSVFQGGNFKDLGKLHHDSVSGIKYQIGTSTLEGYDGAMVLKNRGVVIHYVKSNGLPNFTKDGDINITEGAKILVVHSGGTHPSPKFSSDDNGAIQILPFQGDGRYDVMGNVPPAPSFGSTLGVEGSQIEIEPEERSEDSR